MATRFSVDIFGQQFQCNSMNIKTLCQFQVYVQHDGKEIRFHMMIDENSEFKITDKDRIPEQYHGLESLLSDAILKNAAA